MIYGLHLRVERDFTKKRELNSVVYALWDTMKLSSSFCCLEECANAPSVLFECLSFPSVA